MIDILFSLLLKILIAVLVVVFICECLQRLTNMKPVIDNEDTIQSSDTENNPTENITNPGITESAASCEAIESSTSDYAIVENVTLTTGVESTTSKEKEESKESGTSEEKSISKEEGDSKESETSEERSTIKKEEESKDIGTSEKDTESASINIDTDSIARTDQKTEDCKEITNQFCIEISTSLKDDIINGKEISSIQSELISIPDLLKNTKMSTVYGVNGASFVENEHLSSHSIDSLVHYELYKVEKASTDDESEDEDLTEVLDVHVQMLPQGYIINSNVFLSDAHWHSMALVDGDLFRCAVCQMYCDRANCVDHVKSVNHIRNLAAYKPLKRFDLSVVRKINDNLHCGVCNDIFDIIDYKTHENNKTHEGNLLTAINKVSDLMYDSNIHDNYYTDNKTQSDENRDNFSNFRSVNIPDRNVQIPDRNVQIPDRNVQTPDPDNRNNNHAFHFDANAINNNNISVYEEYSGSEEDEEEYEYELEEYNPPREGISYASMARKPTMQLPKFLKVDMGNKKEVRVKFESWHMIIRPVVNKYYCMVCNKQDHIRFKSQHCISCEHIEKLAKCTVVGAFEDYLIRKVDDKLYHCGHCNNLQYRDQMADHIESAHPKKGKNIIDTLTTPSKPKRTTKNGEKTIPNSNRKKSESETVKTESEKTAILNKSLEYMAETKTAPVIDIFGDVTLCPFGSELRISALSLNIVLEKDEGYYCAVCDKTCEDVKVHVDGLDHMEMMNMTPFIVPFKSNLTRAVRGSFHCGLCNILISATEIFGHNIDQPHTNALANALGMKKKERPIKNTKNTYFGDISGGVENVSAGVDENSAGPQAALKPLTTNLQPKNGIQSSNTLIISDQNTSNTKSVSPSPLKESFKIGNKCQKDIKSEANGDIGNNNTYGQNGQNVLAGQNVYAGQNNPMFPPTFNPMPLPILDPQMFAFKGFNYPNLNVPRPSFPPFPPMSHNITPPYTNQNTMEQKNVDVQKKTKINGIENENKSANDTVKSENDIVKSENDIVKSENDIVKSENRDTSIETIESHSDDEIKEFDLEEIVYLKLKTAFFKITNLSYNTLVYQENGIRHCFVCSNTVPLATLQKHVDSREHTDNICKNKFLDKYGVQLFRQMYLMYHCAICNVLMTRKEIKLHLDWPTHIEKYDKAHKILNKKNRKELKSGTKEFLFETQKETIFHSVQPKINVLSAYQIVRNLAEKKDSPEPTPVKSSKATAVKKKKMIILNNMVMKVSFDQWHGITTSKNITKCLICQEEIKSTQIFEHVETEYHAVALGKTLEKNYYPALIRKINANVVNCMVCNLELMNVEDMIHEHIVGRKHKKNQENINESSNSDSYADCYEDYLNL